MKLDRRFTLGWIGIIVAGLTLEIVAIRRSGKGDTLTEHIRPLLHLHPLIWLTSLGAGIGAGIWAALHLWAGL